jgi:MFS family permease
MFHFRTTQERNFWFMYLEAFFGPFTGIAGAFAGAYAIRLGASNTEIGLMSSIPPLLVILVSIPFGRILQNSSRKLWWALGGISLYRIGYMLFALAPWIQGSFLTPAAFFISMFALVAIPIQFFNIGNVGMMIDIVPDESRATVFTVRNVIGSLVSIGGVFLAGQWLSHKTFPGNYQGLFVITGLFAFMSLFCWLSIRYPQKEKKVEDVLPASTQNRTFKGQVKELTRVFEGQPMFTRFTINTLLLNVGMWMVGPLYVLYTVRQLSASDAWIGTAGTLGSICSLVGWLAGRRLIHWWGDTLTHRRLVLLMGIYPILVGLSPSLSLIMVFGGLYNLFTPGFSLSNYNLWLKVLPQTRREDAAAIYNTIMSVGPFIFPLLGVSLATRFGISPTLIGCGALALLGSISFWVWRIQVQPARS